MKADVLSVSESACKQEHDESNDYSSTVRHHVMRKRQACNDFTSGMTYGMERYVGAMRAQRANDTQVLA